jgi:hypothetical protein
VEGVEEVRVRVAAAAKLLRKAAEKASGELRDILIAESEKLEEYLRGNKNVQREFVGRVAYEELADEIRRWLWSVKIKPNVAESEIDRLVNDAFRELESKIETIIKWFDEAIKTIEGELK